jgi:hypothetical protein
LRALCEMHAGCYKALGWRQPAIACIILQIYCRSIGGPLLHRAVVTVTTDLELLASRDDVG